MNRSACRLFVIRAFDAPLAVILRRGPSRWYHLILWNMDRDTFTEGAWFRGRIYEEKCDLSPDGKLFVYSAFKPMQIGERSAQAWTAISRPPYVTPLAIWPQASTYEGGGRFYGNRRLALGCDWQTAYPAVPKGLEQVQRVTEPQHSMRQSSTDEVPGADWSGYDRLNRTLYTIGGKLFRRSNGRDEELADFTNLTPNPNPPPESATRWP